MTGIKNKLIGALYTILLGAVTGAIVWAFLKVMNLGIELLWERLPAILPLPEGWVISPYPVAVCLIGSLLIGIYKHFTGDYPEELTVVMAKLKKDGRYPYHNILTVLGSFITLPKKSAPAE